jgi:hypothetical protein
MLFPAKVPSLYVAGEAVPAGTGVAVPATEGAADGVGLPAELTDGA